MNIEPVYLIETECGGPKAAGGGCGAPLGLRRVSYELFAACEGTHTGEITNHNPHEHDFDEEEVTDVKLVYRPCSSCYSRY